MANHKYRLTTDWYAVLVALALAAFVHFAVIPHIPW
ncbi:MAG: hypothetical protein JWQ42_2035 [Edaphobacter sp.]|jgi:hypothetical protein|nr:hypothetical protein [Edaphobacter sp.]